LLGGHEADGRPLERERRQILLTDDKVALSGPGAEEGKRRCPQALIRCGVEDWHWAQSIDPTPPGQGLADAMAVTPWR
jgi:hypothetical protein